MLKIYAFKLYISFKKGVLSPQIDQVQVSQNFIQSAKRSALKDFA